MAREAMGPLTLEVESCPEDATRYRWTVREADQVVRSALYSLPDAEAALRQGREAMAEAAALCRDTRGRAPG
ncbi:MULTISPECIES: hypothetical protein [unclassified Methylobacterium]|jgi:hypothetical protein|uniref:hypothetical protein n=1 Tax=unclassified Methylobacterium TaxID=2615210 RepID=UPI0007010F9F|nr:MULTISPECIES: hypothetical protein [unclassified Methylobacterium]KQO70681.1 hypothetical protein ASF18_21330 [Methylobacterium sp. Leaf89]KQO75193.1 hypothetical protein ASF20_15235 [Methylobacterium sp. Leaf88]KQP75218.1 hypothetical protein ASF41_15810 [Methylobacterium sp. Leaf111]KQT71357.1 hypothetical protein ASG51_10450 [Methylobacterium sp. Leaf465]KQU29299.1 hypothetical protein ASG63_17565 [Methylobacterium sp. Leaf94]